MKPEIHPDYQVATVACSCGNRFETRSTKAELHVEICSNCHPFYTGKQKLIDTGGRVERFQKRYAKQQVAQDQVKQKAPSRPAAAPEAPATPAPEAGATPAPADA